MSRIKTIHLIWPPLLIYLVYLLSKLAWFDSLSSLANDSVHYLVMARHYSPWQSESEAIASAWLIQDFPPFFPWLLALSGAAHSLLYAHILVVGLGFVSLYFYYRLSSRWLDNRNWAIFPVIIFSLSPGFILSLQGILSESLYLLLTFIFIFFYAPTENKSKKTILIVSLILAAILLTRTIGVTLYLALIAQASLSSISNKKFQFQSFYVVIIALCIYFLLMAVWGPVRESHYFDILISYLSDNGISSNGSGETYYFPLATQLNSMMQNWTSFWIIFWTDELSGIYIVILILLIISLLGLAIRLYKNKYDAWYALFFILVLFIWPHPGQMFRLMLPVLPLLLIYAGFAIIQLLEIKKLQFNKDLIPIIFYLSVLTTVLPSHAFIHARADMAFEKKMVPVYEIFRRADPVMAEKELLLQNQTLRDFTHLADSILPYEQVMYFLPSYLAVLSNRTGIIAPSPIDKNNYRSIVNENGVSSIFLTRLHPRKTRVGYSGFLGAENLDDWSKKMWCSKLVNGDIASCLYSVEKHAEKK